MENFKIFLLVPNTVYSRALLASLLSKLLLKSRALIELFFFLSMDSMCTAVIIKFKYLMSLTLAS